MLFSSSMRWRRGLSLTQKRRHGGRWSHSTPPPKLLGGTRVSSGLPTTVFGIPLKKSWLPLKVWTRVIIFVKKYRKISGFFRKWLLSLHRKTAKFLYIALALPILKISQKEIKIIASIQYGEQFLIYNICWKMETEIRHIAKMSLKLPRQN